MATLFGKANMPLIGNNVRYADSVQWRIPGKLSRGPSERVYIDNDIRGPGTHVANKTNGLRQKAL